MAAGVAVALVSVGGVARAVTGHGSSTRTTGVRLEPMAAGHPLEPVKAFIAVEHGAPGLVRVRPGERALTSPMDGETWAVRSHPAAVLDVSSATVRPALQVWQVRFSAPKQASFDHPLLPRAFVADIDGAGVPLLPLSASSDGSNFAIVLPTEPYALLVASEITTSSRLATPVGDGRFAVSSIAPLSLTRD